VSLLEGGLEYERSEIEGSRPTCCAERKVLKGLNYSHSWVLHQIRTASLNHDFAIEAGDRS